MKRLILIFLLVGALFADTRYFLPVTIESSNGRPIKNANVDLYQSGSKVVDCVWLNAGRYYYTSPPTDGLYDIYVNGVSHITNVYIGNNDASALTADWQSDIGDTLAVDRTWTQGQIGDSNKVVVGTKTIHHNTHTNNLGFVSFGDYNPVYDGVTDNRTKLLSAIADAKASNSKTLIFQADTFYVSGTFDVSGLKIRGNGAVLKGDGLSATDATLYAYGDTAPTDYAGGLIPLTERAKKGDNWIKSTLATTLSVGDLIKIMSSEKYETVSNSTKGEMHLVDAISGTIIYLDSPLFQSYNMDSTSVYNVGYTTLDISDLTIMLDDEKNGAGVIAKRALNPKINVVVLQAKRSGVVVSDCWSPAVNSVTVNTDNVALGYGIKIDGGMYGKITGTYTGGWHAVSFGGSDNQAWGYKVYDCVGSVNTINAGAQVFDQHPPTGSVEWSNCTAYGAASSDFSSISLWLSGTTYSSGDTVYASNDKYYIASQSTTGDNPVTDYTQTYWNPVYRLTGSSAGTGFKVRGGSAIIENCSVYNVAALVETDIDSDIHNLIVDGLVGDRVYNYGFYFTSGTSIDNLVIKNIDATKISFRQADPYFVGMSSDVSISQWDFSNIKTKNFYGFNLLASDVPEDLIITNYTGSVDTTAYKPNTLQYNLICGKQKNITLTNFNLSNVGNLLDYGNISSPVDLENLVLNNCMYQDRGIATPNKIINIRTNVDKINIDNSSFELHPNSTRKALISLSAGKENRILNFTNNTIEGKNSGYYSMISDLISADADAVDYFYQTGNQIDWDDFNFFYTGSPKCEIINGSINNIMYCRADTIPEWGKWAVGAIVIKRNSLPLDSSYGWICTTAGAANHGTWNASNTYVRDDQVSYAGAIYRALFDGGEAEQPNTDTDHTYWYRVNSTNTTAAWKKLRSAY